MFRKNASDAFWFVASCGLGMVVWDFVRLLLSRSGAPIRDLLMVLAALIALTVAHVFVAGAVVAPGYAFALGNRSTWTLFASPFRWLQDRLRTQEASDAAIVHASLLAAPAAIVAFAGVAVPISMSVHDAVRVARNAALASLLVHVAAALAAAFVFVSVRGAWHGGLRRLADVRFVSAWIRRPWITALALGLTCMLGAATAMVLSRRVLAALDLAWLWAALVVLAIGGAVAWLRTLPRLSVMARRIVGFGWIGLLVIFAGVATFALSYSNNVRALLVRHTMYGKLFNEGQTAVFDRDGDGYTAFFGGNDCAPRDKAINPGAMDVPYNGIDEDCSGEDLRYDAELPKGSWDAPLPAGIPKRPHIILLTVDALNPNHLGFNGYERPTSKNIDAFSKRSVRFTNAYAQGPSTRLSFPSLFISKYDPQIKRAKVGRIPLAILPENLTFAEIFRKAGYKTIAVVPDSYFRSWRGITQGFQVVDESAARSKDKQTSALVSDAVIQRLEEAKDGKAPVLLWAHYYDPHGPFDQPPGSPTFGTRPKDRYDAEIHHTDMHMGRVLDWISENLPKSDRVIIVTADHGESFDDQHASKHHGFDLHSNVLHVPLMFDVPGVAPRTVDGPVTLLDIAPTLVNLVQLKGSYSFEGTSLVPALLRGEGLDDRVTFHTFYLPEDVKRDKDPLRIASARTERYNLIHNRAAGVYSLFDFTVDPVERTNIYDSRPELASALRTRLQLWHFRVTGGVVKVPAPPASANKP